MYNIHSHYENIYYYAKLHFENPTVKYLFPFGSSDIANVEILRTGDAPGPVLFCYDQEPLIYHYNRFLLSDIQLKSQFDIAPFQKAPHNSNKANSYIIFLNTEKDSLEKEKILKEYRFIDCYYFYHALAASDWYRGYKYDFRIQPIKQRRFDKKFISFNRITGNSRVYRSLFVAELMRRNILNHGLLSYSKTCPVHGSLKNNFVYARDTYKLSGDYVSESYKLLEYHLETDLRIDGSIHEQIQNDSFAVGPVTNLMSSFLHVVTETCFWDTKKHLTEKIFKPIVLKQPFVLLGSQNNLSYLKEYGFKTFDKWWNEDYDKCSDPIQRINKVCDIIENICSLSQSDLQDLALEMEETLEYNYNRFFSKTFVQDVWTELLTNLDSAFSQFEY
jgi:hypothetical protein